MALHHHMLPPAVGRIAGLVRQGWRSPALRSAAVLAAGGLGFALGNLLLARILAEHEYGTVALLLSLIQVAAALGSLGLPTLVNRHRLHATTQLFRYSVTVAALAGGAVTLLAVVFYNLPFAIACVLGATAALASIGRVAGAVLQSEQHFGTSMLLTQIHNWLLLASVPVVLVVEQRSAMTVALFIMLSYLITTMLGWRYAARLPRMDAGSLTLGLFWSQGLTAAGFGFAINLFFQLDRLVIGRVLSMQELAVYSVIAAIAGSVFRMLQVGAGHTLTPRLRAAKARAPALAILRHEAALVFGIALLATPPLLILTPWIVHGFLGERFQSPYALVIAIIVVGFIRLWEGFSAAVVNAIGSARELFFLSVLGWAAVGIGVIVALACSRYGLVGVVYGLGAGWCAIALGATALARTALARLELNGTPSAAATSAPDAGRLPR